MIRLTLKEFLVSPPKALRDASIVIRILTVGRCRFNALKVRGTNRVTVFAEVFSCICLVKFRIRCLMLLSVRLVLVNRCCVCLISALLTVEGRTCLCACDNSPLLICDLRLVTRKSIAGGVRRSIWVVLVNEFRLVTVINACRWLRSTLCTSYLPPRKVEPYCPET